MNAPLSPRPQNKDAPGTILAVVFIAMGCLAWWDTYSMSDADSYMFPRAIIVTLILCCLLLIGRNLIWGGGRRGQPLRGSLWRRAALVLVMLGAALAMPVVGFVPVGLVLFAVSMLLAMFEPWTRKKAIMYPLIGVGVVAMFYALFAMLLNVALPTGVMFS
ncbi:tripartite tricarboxylate transporter TctB family protein [Varunaivibrio sulfuroxidans]|uniref:Putative tricarboxylic transport membrane protein n=1 Tax=Varunaivibrio sulfuroxidans TaxID=1773489 RepID=A0A4R3JB22_9PROT|nr:tripartite tricarboxylate transporter TctB family protein [Varunaivibrio sulfuroxidans]TCS63088.1 putative tricarboxylic transport membrane protein [Varunaivibrio sulfuroxidans]WES31840.1 tripartite tricarboxylate transporter TctB family protein [Varunaivibrio sulfuroxidans]